MLDSSEIRSCVKVEVAVQGSAFLENSPCGLCGRKATLNLDPVLHGQSSGAV